MPVKHFTERGTVLRPKSLENLVLAFWRRARNNERDRWLEVTFIRRFAGKSNGEIKPNLWPWFTKFKSRWTYICTAMKNYPGMRMVFNTTLPRPWHTIPTTIRALCSRYRTTYASNYTRAFLTLFNTVKFNGIPCPSVDDTNQVTRIGCRASRDYQSQRNLLESMMNLRKARSPPTDNRIIMLRQILSAFASV